MAVVVERPASRTVQRTPHPVEWPATTLDRHPTLGNVTLVGGGSGHGFKHGPPMAERLAAAFATGTTLPADFGLGERSRSRSLRTASSGIAT